MGRVGRSVKQLLVGAVEMMAKRSGGRLAALLASIPVFACIVACSTNEILVGPAPIGGLSEQVALEASRSALETSGLEVSSMSPLEHGLTAVGGGRFLALNSENANRGWVQWEPTDADGEASYTVYLEIRGQELFATVSRNK